MKLVDSSNVSKLTLVESKNSYDRRYAGAVLFDRQHNVILQSRDKKPGIVNPGKLTLFGGGQDENETPVQCMARELKEELNLEISTEELCFLGYIDKIEADGIVTRCSVFTLHNVDPASLQLREGRAIVARPPEDFLSDPLVSEVSKISIRESLSKYRLPSSTTSRIASILALKSFSRIRSPTTVEQTTNALITPQTI